MPVIFIRNACHGRARMLSQPARTLDCSSCALPRTCIAAVVAVTSAFLTANSALAANDAILQNLERIKVERYRFELDAPSEARRDRIQAAQQQIDRVTRLVQLEQYESARLQLREGVVSSLRKDLRDAQESYKRVTPQMVDEVKSELEKLDQSLRFEDADEIWNHLAATDVALKNILTVITTTTPF